MRKPCRGRNATQAAAIALAASALVLATPASAGGLFESLFGGMFGSPRSAPPPMPPQASSYAEPSYTPGSNDRVSGGGETGGTGVYSAYCVRLCDGRYFPVQRHAGASPADVCHSFCPASKTAVFSGSKIDTAAGPRGERYADLDNAFVYREKLVDGCTCNGKNTFGLAHVDLKADPTLRPGDIVATNDGFATFRGKGASKTADFTPINPSSSAWAKHLAETKIKPAPVAVVPPPVVVSNDTRVDRRRVQAAR